MFVMWVIVFVMETAAAVLIIKAIKHEGLKLWQHKQLMKSMNCKSR